MKKVLLLVVLTFAGTLSVFGQNGNFDINLLLGAPVGDFADNLDRTAIGIDLGYAFQTPSSPIQFGLEAGIMTYGIDTRNEAFNPNIPEVTVQVQTDYDIFQTHAFLRFEPQNTVFTPYVDGLIGFKYLFTQTRIEDNGSFETIASNTNFDDFAFSYGFGLGFKVQVFEKDGKRYHVNLKSRYLFGSEASYLQPGSITVNNGELIFNESTSSTDLFTLHLGLAVSL